MDERIEILKCYICDEEIHDEGKDLFNNTSDYSNTSMHELLEKLSGQELKIPDENRWLGCPSCIDKISEYDLACVTAERVQKELTNLLQQTTEKYNYQSMEIISSPKEEEIELGEHLIMEDEVAYVVKEVDMSEKYNEPLEEETDEYEIQFFTTDDNDNEDEPDEMKDVIIQEQSEYVNYEEAVKEDIVVEVPETQEDEEEENQVRAGEKSVVKLRTTKPRKNTLCKICKIDFASYKELSDHRKQSHDNGERLVCDICGVRYKTRATLNIHLDLHKGISPFRCEICGKNFTQKGALKRHRPIHTGERPYQCDKCGKQFTHYSSFHMHNLAHDDIRDKKCEICGLLLRSSSHLNRHMLVHTGQKPHACPSCGQRFAQRYNMMSHYRSHQGIHRRKKHLCNVCNKGFTKENLLLKHIAEKACKPPETISVLQIVDNDEYNIVSKDDSDS